MIVLLLIGLLAGIPVHASGNPTYVPPAATNQYQSYNDSNYPSWTGYEYWDFVCNRSIWRESARANGQCDGIPLVQTTPVPSYNPPMVYYGPPVTYNPPVFAPPPGYNPDPIQLNPNLACYRR
ncbi:MAG: DUF3300 domain-containing protein [Candidatus Yanofskybacteria bacterium]|nr:DUF3300 domain-containing protein [Candidatus Yanofskybacteria bacterium]